MLTKVVAVLGKVRKWLRRGKISLKGYAIFAGVWFVGMWLGSWIASTAVKTSDKAVAWFVAFLLSAGIGYFIWEKYAKKEAEH